MNCPSCQTSFQGKYCHQCGEKQVSSKDFSIFKIIQDGFSSITNLDSKIYKSIKGLLFQPGHLPTEYILGKRVDYMKPFQIFILCSVLFYLVLPDLDIFLIPSQWFFTDHTGDIVHQIMERKSISKEMLAQMYDSAVLNNSKLFVFLLLPFIALILTAFNFKHSKEYGKYLIHALYLLSFFMVLLVSVTVLIDNLLGSSDRWMYIIPNMLVFLVYIIFSIKKMNPLKWWQAILQGIVFMTLFFFIVGSYRYGISYWTLVNL